VVVAVDNPKAVKVVPGVTAQPMERQLVARAAMQVAPTQMVGAEETPVPAAALDPSISIPIREQGSRGTTTRKAPEGSATELLAGTAEVAMAVVVAAAIPMEGQRTDDLAAVPAVPTRTRIC